MRKAIVKAFPKTEDAAVVEKYLGSEIPAGFIFDLLISDYSALILKEARRREQMANEKEEK